MKPSETYLRICQFAFVFACCIGGNFALSYLDFVHGNTWAAWRPGIGIAILFASMVLSFVGYARCAQHSSGTASQTSANASSHPTSGGPLKQHH